MSNRFPGMNPYLEDPFHWQGFHNLLIAEISKSLNAVLPAGYRAVIEQRLAILPEDQVRRADLALIRRPMPSSLGQSGGAAVKERGMPDGKVGALSEEIYDWYVEVRTGRRPDNRVVTVIELLSPTNKASGTEGRRDYQHKQQELLHSDTHLMEIDLLRHGAHTVMAPLQRLPPRDTWDYIICLHRATERYQWYYWLNRLTEPLPEIRVPLLQDDPDVFLDLQAVFQESYVEGRFEDDIDFTTPLPENAWRQRE